MTRQRPWLTVTMAIVTLAVTAAMAVWPVIGTALQRDPVMLSGHQYWRFVTTWFVLVDGWPQIIMNTIGLLIYGYLVERNIGRGGWLVAYVVAGLTGEVAGLFWQPVGGGNSVAICGLIGLFSVWLIGRRALPLAQRLGGALVWGAVGLWLLVHSDIHGAALAAGFVVGGVALIQQRRYEALLDG